ncbi:MAG: class I SAM-dependent methyltransferase [Burkholderiales bacterium]
MPGIRNQESIAKYRTKAPVYDARSHRTWKLRERTIAHLRLRHDDVVVDAGCGTGLSFELLLASVGPSGRVIGIEQSPEMFALARERVARAGWANVEVMNAYCETVELPARFDAILFNYTHDILRTNAAVARLFRFAKPDARVAIAGMKYFPWWTGPLNIYAFFKNRAYNGVAGDLWAPWDIVAQHIADLRISSTQFGMGYIAHGIARSPVAQSSAGPS